MFNKPQLQQGDSTGSFVLAQSPPRIALGSSVLASAIDLPPQSHISYSIFSLQTMGADVLTVEHVKIVEQARRHVWQRNESHSVLDSLLTSVRVARDSASLYVFALGSAGTTSTAESVLQTTQLEGLTSTGIAQFRLSGLYPCSVACSTRLTPCPACTNETNQPSRSSVRSSLTSSACLLPRIPLRRTYAQFLQALRERLIDDVAKASNPCRSGEEAVLRPARSAIRLKDGFLLGFPPSSGEWNTGWIQQTARRTLMNCRLHIQLASSHILIQPVLRPTWYLPLASVLPIPPGAPIVLLPHGASAYYLSTYVGSVGGLTAHFQASFLGSGVGDWVGQSPSMAASTPATATPSYAVIWISVQNKQGEERGVVAIWPTSLCVAFSSGAPTSPPPLASIPTMPPQLQASQVAPVPTSTTKTNLHAFTPTVTASSMPSPATDLHTPHVPTSRRSTPNPQEAQGEVRPTAPLPTRSFLVQSSPTSDSLYALKTLTLSNRDIGKVAREVSGYVDSVAKEREKERERLRRERESSSSRITATGHSPTKSEERAITAEPVKMLPVRSASIKCTVVEAAAPQRADTSSSLTARMRASPDAMVQDSSPTPQKLPTSTPAPEIVPAPLPGQSSAEVALPAPVASSATPSSSSPTSSSGTNNQFETFGSFENSWGQSPAEFINLGMDIDNFDVSLDYSMGMDVNGDGSGGFGAEDGFGPFTEDDFNFFDAPSARSAPHPAPGVLPSVGMSSHAHVVTTATNLGMHASGPGPPPVHAQAPWSHGMAEGFTPQSLNAATPSILPAPDLIPSTPTVTPQSHSVPATPTVILADQPQSGHARKSSRSMIFDPIPFAEVHKLTDDKYAMGKFALPTPPDEEDRTHPIPRTPFRPSADGWKTSYTAVTDPRVGIINRLKRKRHKDEPYSGRRASPAWTMEYEEWASSPCNAGSDADMDDQRSESDNDDDTDVIEEVPEVHSPSRAHTPPPAYLPLGPTLIPTHFFHPYMLSLSVPLKPPGTNMAGAAGGVAGPMSVPTPVSPSAVLGDAAEKSQALEDAAKILVHELVENCAWESCWRSLLTSVHGTKKPPGDVWQVDVQYVARLLGCVELLRTPLDLKDAFKDRTVNRDVFLQELDSPLLAVGKSNTVVQVLPPALRFWEKLGLGPRAGPKDTSAFIVYEGSDDEKEQLLANWLEKVSQIYAARRFGKHTPGRAPGCVRDGLVPIHFETIRKTLTSFITGLPQPDTPAIFYIVVPSHIINLNNIALRRVLHAVRRAAKNSTQGARVFQLVPEPFMNGAMDDPSMSHSGLEFMVSSVYDRLQVPARRVISRVFSAEDKRPVFAFFYEPAFTLVPRTPSTIKFIREAHPSSLDVLDRRILLHIGYLVSSCGKWLFLTAIDQAGTTHDLKALLTPSEGLESFIVSNVWDFALGMALKANVEWHIAVARFGFMAVGEYDAWMSYLGSDALFSYDIPPPHVTLLVVEAERMWHFVLPCHSQAMKSLVSPNRIAKVVPGTTFHDVSAITYLLRPSRRFALSVPSETSLSPSPPYVAEPDDDKPIEELGMRPFSTTSLIRVPAESDFTAVSALQLHLMGYARTLLAAGVDDDETLETITRNYYDLSVLTSQRWNLRSNRILPFHLAALEVMQLALDRSEATTE